MDPFIDILDPSKYAAVRKPVEEASHLPAWCYTSEAFYAREIEVGLPEKLDISRSRRQHP